MRFLTTSVAVLWLIVPVSGAVDAPTAPRRAPAEGPAPLPQPVTSFGAAVQGEWLYVYGGHIGRAHAHSKDNHSRNFARLHLARRGASWESLPMGTPLQGLAMVADQGKVYRIGGLSMRNNPEDDEQLHSVDEFFVYDPQAGAWRELARLPEPRSSHDAAVLDGKVYVVGGWRLAGQSDSAVWAERGYTADLRAPEIEWKPLPPQPFRHRALAVATTTRRVYVIGGLNADGKPTSEVHIFDPASQSWTRGPDLPTATRVKAFAASAFGVGDTIWASALDGRVYRLEEGADQWIDTGYELRTPRFFHRIQPHGDRSLLFVAGAGKEGHLDSVETVELATLLATPLERLSSDAVSKRVEAADQPGAEIWPGFRGDGSSHSSARGLPADWSDERGVAWKAELAGYGQSSPVVWRDRVFVTSIEGASQETLHVMCVHARDGSTIWKRSFPASQTVASTGYVSKAAPTPAIDEHRLYLFFESGDLIALDHDGRTVWQRSLVKEYGPIKGNHGLGASLAQTDDALIVLVDHDGPSYLLSIDKTTGANGWKVDRRPRVSWSSPIVHRESGRSEIVISSNGVVEAFDAATGRQLWSIEDFAGNTVASPTVAGRHVIVGSSERGSNVCIERPVSDGMQPMIKWRAEGALASFASPLVYGPAVYYVNKAGVATCVDLATGQATWSFRLPSSCWASPVAVGGHIFFFCTAGQTVVIRAGTAEPIKVAESNLDIEGRIYGVAAVNGQWILRSGSQLIAIGSDGESSGP